MQQRAVRLEEIPLAYGAVPLPPGAATRMPVGTEVPPAYPAPIGAVGIRAEVERGVHLARPSPRGHDAGWWAPRRLGSVRVGLLTGGTGGLAGEARKGCGLTVVLWQWAWGFRCRWTHGGGVAGPRPLEHDAQPYQGDQHQLVEKKRRDHGKTPSDQSRNEGILRDCSINTALSMAHKGHL